MQRLLSYCLILSGLFLNPVTAQMSTYTDTNFGYTIHYPAGWTVEQAVGGTEINASDTIGFGIFVVPFSPEEMEQVQHMSLDDIAGLMINQFQSEMPNFRLGQISNQQVAGLPARAFGFNGTDPETMTAVTGTMTVFMKDSLLYSLVYAAEPTSYPQYETTFASMLASFSLQAQSPVADQSLPSSQASNTLLDPFIGTFADSQLQLSLQGSAAQYSGQLIFNNQTFPVMAQGSAGQLRGIFSSAGNQFEFSASLQGDTLVFTTGTTSYTLQRQAASSPSTDTNQNSTSQYESIRLKEVQVIDEHGFGQPILAMTLMIPHDWTKESLVLWTPHPCISAPQAVFAVASPDELSGFATLPMESWFYSNINLGIQVPKDCLSEPIRSARDYLHAAVRRSYPSAQVLEYRDHPEIAAQFQSWNTHDPFTGMRTWVEAAEIRYAYSHQGQPVHESIGAVVMITETSIPDAMGGVLQYLNGFAFGFVIRAPAGQLSEFGDFAGTLLSMSRVNPEWNRLIAEHYRKMNQPRSSGGSTPNNTIAETNRYISDLMSESFENRMASNDRIDTMFSETIRGVESYSDPVLGQQVELPAHYDNSWRLSDGSYVLTNDPLFDPYRSWGIDGQQLERAP